MSTSSTINVIPGASSSSSSVDAETLRRNRIHSSKLYFDVPLSMVPLIYSSSYDIAFFGIEKLHPFDSSKWGRICQFLIKDGVLERSRIVEPLEASNNDLLVVHSESYLSSLKNSYKVAVIIEVPPVGLLPNCLVQQKVLYPFRKQVGGTILAAKLAKERGWAINVGGGFHHCCADKGGGFCVYADISLCIIFAFTRLNISRVMIIDLDAHQGNGHEMDFGNDSRFPLILLRKILMVLFMHFADNVIPTGRVYILDMYNPDIYPFDFKARIYIDQSVQVQSGTPTEVYLEQLDKALEVAGNNFNPELVVYNAGTDILDGDPLGQLKVSPDGVASRDEKVFRFAKEKNIPLVMLTSGGYMKSSAKVIADSLTNLSAKGLIDLATPPLGT
ncbi:hypothetical protein C5167_031534 [Papaver somniferum]|uniref:Histone deacetylase domain-containing protein n=1 Tax=Papaver somniferum TaxID=3469 RepID=A0A4Y7K4J3_PAPSO|nr:hypothetical protein C5167_031534 [Papaver somniferum]